MPLVLSKTYLSLHGSAVAFNDQAIAFVGSSGNGKSTLSNKLREIGQFISDDFLLIEKISNKHCLHSTYPGLRLLSEEDSRDKIVIKVPRNSYSSSPSPLQAIYVLTRDRNIPKNEYLISDLHQDMNLDLLLSEVLMLDPDLPGAQLEMIEDLTQLSQSIPIKKLSFSDLTTMTDTELAKALQST